MKINFISYKQPARLDFFTGNNIFSVSPFPAGEKIAKINNITILKINSADGLTTNKITSNATTDFVLNAPTGQKIEFDIGNSLLCSINQYGLISTNTIFSDVFKYYSGTVNLAIMAGLGKAIDFFAGSSIIAYLDYSGFFVNQIYSQAGQNLNLDAQTGIIQTSSSLLMYGGNLNLYDYSTGLIQSQLFTNSSGLNIISPIDMTFKTTNSTNKINFNVGTATIAYVNSTGMTLETNLNINSSSSTTASIVLINAVSAPKIQSTSSLILQSATSGSVLINNGTATIASFGTTSLNMTADIEMTLGNILISYGYYQQFLTSSISVKWKFKPSGTSMQVANSSGVGAEITNGATSWTAISDIRLKKNIEPLKNSLELINQLNPITYNWKDESMTNNNIGFIAQEVEKVIPEITTDYYIEDDKYLGIRTTDLIPFLVKSIQELSKELKDIREILKRNNIKY